MNHLSISPKATLVLILLLLLGTTGCDSSNPDSSRNSSSATNDSIVNAGGLLARLGQSKFFSEELTFFGMDNRNVYMYYDGQRELCEVTRSDNQEGPIVGVDINDGNSSGCRVDAPEFSEYGALFYTTDMRKPIKISSPGGCLDSKFEFGPSDDNPTWMTWNVVYRAKCHYVSSPLYRVEIEADLTTSGPSTYEITRKWGSFQHMYTGARIEYDVNNSDEWNLVNPDCREFCSGTIQDPLPGGATVRIRVKDLTLNRETIEEFAVEGAPPTPPAPSVSGTIVNDRPRLSWNAVSGATSYEINGTGLLGGTDNGTTPSTSWTGTFCVKGPPAHSAMHMIFYKVRAVNSEGQPGPWSSELFFNLKNQTAPWTCPFPT